MPPPLGLILVLNKAGNQLHSLTTAGNVRGTQEFSSMSVVTTLHNCISYANTIIVRIAKALV